MPHPALPAITSRLAELTRAELCALRVCATIGDLLDALDDADCAEREPAQVPAERERPKGSRRDSSASADQPGAGSDPYAQSRPGSPAGRQAAKGHIEEKTINGYGPYLYLRRWTESPVGKGKTLTSTYIGKKPLE
jgi:hypothetical protein